MPKLMKTVLELETDNGEGKEWINLMSTAKYSSGDLYIKFNPAMKPYLLGLKEKFTQFKLMDAMKFKSTYTLRLFLLLKQYDSTGWRHMKVDEIREQKDLERRQSDAHLQLERRLHQRRSSSGGDAGHLV